MKAMLNIPSHWELLADASRWAEAMLNIPSHWEMFAEAAGWG